MAEYDREDSNKIRTMGSETGRADLPQKGEGIGYELDRAQQVALRLEKTLANLTEHLQPILLSGGLKDGGDRPSPEGVPPITRRIQDLIETLQFIDGSLQDLNQRVHL